MTEKRLLEYMAKHRPSKEGTSEQWKAYSKKLEYELMVGTELNPSSVESSIMQFKEEELPDAETPFHHNAEVWSGMQRFIDWLKQKQQK